MRRLFWVAVGAATAVVTLREARRVVDEHVPAGARSALGAAAGLGAAVSRVREEFLAGTAQREAELRADLLAGADLTRSRATVDAWRAERAERGQDARVTHDEDASGPRSARRAGSHTGSHAVPPAVSHAVSHAVSPGGAPTGSHRAEDPEDGPLGYSF